MIPQYWVCAHCGETFGVSPWGMEFKGHACGDPKTERHAWLRTPNWRHHNPRARYGIKNDNYGYTAEGKAYFTRADVANLARLSAELNEATNDTQRAMLRDAVKNVKRRLARRT